MTTANTLDQLKAEKPAKAPRAAERILGVARDLFYRKGIRAIGVDEVVRQAGVTKPSLYRSFASKDDLTAAYLTKYDQDFWERFELSVKAHPRDPRAQVLDYLARLETRAAKPGYRGCGLTNACVEYPEVDHPARAVSEANKRELRSRFRKMAAEMGARDPDALGDGLLLLFEGTLITSQIFGPEGPASSVSRSAALLIDASLHAERPAAD
jgi:AcrR family transcriptional regulator